MRADTKGGAWAHARAAKAREVVRRAIVESLDATVARDPRDPASSLWSGGALALAGDLVQRLGLAPIGKDFVARVLANFAKGRPRRALPEPGR